MSVREDSLVAEQKIRTVLPNLIKLKEAVVNILHVSGIFRKKISRLWKSLKIIIIIIIIIESLLSHKINNHISYVTTLKEGIYINYRENQDKNYKTRLCLKIKRLTNVFLNLSVFMFRYPRATYEREEINKLTIWLQVISEYSLMVQ